MRKKQNPLLLAALVCAALYLLYEETLRGPSPTSLTPASQQVLLSAIDEQRSDVQLEAEGTVVKVLPDDTRGSKHQRFLLEVAPGKTVLVAHNIDLAPRIPNLREGDSVRFYGEFEWNDKGGVVHWTHHDPGGRHPDGWLKHRGAIYQ
jgi:hypothetical protein